MEREPRRRKSIANRRSRRGGSSSNPHHNEDRMVKPFPPNVRFGHEGQRTKFNQFMARQFAPMKYLSTSSLQRTGLLNEVNMYVYRMGWETFVGMKHPTYIVPTCEFLSSFEFDVDEALLNFRLGNQDHTIGLFELNDVFHFPKDKEANIEYDRDEFWGELTGQRDVIYQPRMSKDSKIRSHSLRYLHRLMSHSLFPRKEGDSVVSTIELNILYGMVNNIQLDVCHVLASKFKDLTIKTSGVIKIGGLVLAIASYVGFDIENMPFDKLPGSSFIDLPMMEAMGLIEMELGGIPHLIGNPQQQQPMQEEEDESELQQVMQRMDSLELQVGVIDSNVGELTSMAQEMRHDLTMMNQNLLAYFQHQNFFPPPFPPHDQGHP